MTQMSLSILEVIVLVLGAIVLGITIHFFIISRRNLKGSSSKKQKSDTDLEEWKLKYFNDVEIKEKEVSELRQRLSEAENNARIYSMDLEEFRRQNKKLSTDLDITRKAIPQPQQGEKIDYLEQLRQAQDSLMEHNEKIDLLLQNIGIAKEVEGQRQELVEENEELKMQIKDFNYLMEEKDKEISNIKQKANLTKEMNSMLDNAYSEFSLLQNKIQKLESQVASSRMLNLEFEDIKEAHQKQTQDLEAAKIKINALTTETQQLALQLHTTEDKLIEATFQRQQLQKRVTYLEELNSDLQVMADANKKLEGQIKRIGELESKLNVVAEERDELIRKSPNSM